GHGHHYIKLKLEGVASNRPGIGARIKVSVKTPGGDRSIYKTMSSGGSFGSSPLRLEIGLGDALGIERVEIRWPSGGAPQVLTGIPMDGAWLVKEGGTGATPIPLRKFRLGGSKAR
ncbi:MAG TPA: ASPIC/UnbV domain-containing protein, partial [Candidatus Binatia bacterium]|nr:ASPIC/UnbV domain-containing protein [Candidatus Binatia bacterium]